MNPWLGMFLASLCAGALIPLIACLAALLGIIEPIHFKGRWGEFQCGRKK